MTNSQKLDLLLDEMHGMRKEFGERLDRVENRLDRVEKRLDRVENRLNRVEERLDRVENRLNRVEERLDKVEEHLAKVDSRLDKLESDTSSLKEGQLGQSRLLKYLAKRVEETYQIALDAWGQSTENRRLITAPV